MGQILLPTLYKDILESDLHDFLLHGGRLGGKSKGTANLCGITMCLQPYTDIIVCRASYGALSDSSYSEIASALEEFEGLKDQLVLKKSPLRIERKNDAGTIYFIGYGGSNTSRTKSIHPKHKISMIIMEETQELKDRRNLDEALASFRRNYSEDVRVFILGNNPPQEAHWFNRFVREKELDSDWFVRNVSWKDIASFINDFDLKEILKTKLLDPDYYNWFYMGQSYSAFGAVYPMFRKEKHIITIQQFSQIIESNKVRVVGCVIGGDGAVNRDATSFVPYLLLNNGQCVIGPIFYHDPKTDNVIGYHQLVQDHLTRWFDDLCRQFHLGTRQEILEHPNIQAKPIWMRIDSAAPDLIQECRFFFGHRANVAPIKKLHVPQMVATVQSAICNDNIVIIDYHGYYNYYQNKFIKKDINLLAEQWLNLVWNEKQDNYDPIVPNDVSDAATYACVFWYSNQENIQYFNILKMNNVTNFKIRDILNK